MDELMTTHEVAAMLRLTPEHVRTLHQQGKGPVGFRSGSRTLYRREKVLAWIEARERADLERRVS